MKGLKEMVDSLIISGEMVRYFNKEIDPKKCVYDSNRISHFLTCCEEVSYAIKDGDYEAAERIIFDYLCLEKL